MFYKILGFAILCAFYGCYFIKMLLQHRQGIATNQMGKGKTGAEKYIEITLSIATFMAPMAQVASILLVKKPPINGIRAEGAAAGILGVAVFILSVTAMGDSWRAGVSTTDKTRLVTKGIYSISRNPAFLAFDLVYLSFLQMFFNWPLFALSLFAALMLHLQIVLVEEKYLVRAFGDEYIEYSKNVRRYLGRGTAQK